MGRIRVFIGLAFACASGASGCSMDTSSLDAGRGDRARVCDAAVPDADADGGREVGTDYGERDLGSSADLNFSVVGGTRSARRFAMRWEAPDLWIDSDCENAKGVYLWSESVYTQLSRGYELRNEPPGTPARSGDRLCVTLPDGPRWENDFCVRIGFTGPWPVSPSLTLEHTPMTVGFGQWSPVVARPPGAAPSSAPIPIVDVVLPEMRPGTLVTHCLSGWVITGDEEYERRDLRARVTAPDGVIESNTDDNVAEEHNWVAQTRRRDGEWSTVDLLVHLDHSLDRTVEMDLVTPTFGDADIWAVAEEPEWGVLVEAGESVPVSVRLEPADNVLTDIFERGTPGWVFRFSSEWIPSDVTEPTGRGGELLVELVESTTVELSVRGAIDTVRAEGCLSPAAEGETVVVYAWSDADPSEVHVDRVRSDCDGCFVAELAGMERGVYRVQARYGGNAPVGRLGAALSPVRSLTLP